MVVNLLRRYFIVFTILAGLLFLGLCTRSYIDSKPYARCYVSLNYANARKGLAPNMTHYNMYDFKSPELMARVLDAAGIKNVSPYELADCVHIATRGSKSGEYVSTGYTLSVRLTSLKDRDLHIDAISMLHLIVENYTQMFYDSSVAQAKVLLFNDIDMEGCEYRELSDYYALKLTILSNHLNERALSNSTFVSETTGLSFPDLLAQVNNLRSVDLARINASLNSTGITLSKKDYLAKLAYLNYRDSETFQRYFSSYSVRLSNISYYDILQSAFVMVPTVDQKGEFYMSMTKTGVDEIARAAQNWNEQSAVVMTRIEAADQTIENILKSKNLKADHTTIQEAFAALHEKISELTNQALLTDGDYMAYTTSNYVTFTDSPLPASDKTDFSGNLLKAALFYIALWLLAWRFLARKERKVV